MNNRVFVLRIERWNGPECDVMVEECYQSRTNAVKAMREYWEKEKEKWLKDASWRKEEDFTYTLGSDGGHISYGWGSDFIDFKLTNLKIKDFKKEE